MSETPEMEEYEESDRWVSGSGKVWEKRSWGWKFLGIVNSYNFHHVMGLCSTECDHPEDIFFNEL